MQLGKAFLQPENYRQEQFAAYNYADCSLIHIENFAEDAADVKILVVKDSFANSVAPFLALCVKQTDILDPRWFKGSIRSYINPARYRAGYPHDGVGLSVGT